VRFTTSDEVVECVWQHCCEMRKQRRKSCRTSGRYTIVVICGRKRVVGAQACVWHIRSVRGHEVHVAVSIQVGIAAWRGYEAIRRVHSQTSFEICEVLTVMRRLSSAIVVQACNDAMERIAINSTRLLRTKMAELATVVDSERLMRTCGDPVPHHPQYLAAQELHGRCQHRQTQATGSNIKVTSFPGSWAFSPAVIRLR
jgi:hypothetical protein